MERIAISLEQIVIAPDCRPLRNEGERDDRQPHQGQPNTMLPEPRVTTLPSLIADGLKLLLDSIGSDPLATKPLVLLALIGGFERSVEPVRPEPESNAEDARLVLNQIRHRRSLRDRPLCPCTVLSSAKLTWRPTHTDQRQPTSGPYLDHLGKQLAAAHEKRADTIWRKPFN